MVKTSVINTPMNVRLESIRIQSFDRNKEERLADNFRKAMALVTAIADEKGLVLTKVTIQVNQKSDAFEIDVTGRRRINDGSTTNNDYRLRYLR